MHHTSKINMGENKWSLFGNQKVYYVFFDEINQVLSKISVVRLHKGLTPVVSVNKNTHHKLFPLLPIGKFICQNTAH